jgi:L-lactate dehydrogenase complex protein LldF
MNPLQSDRNGSSGVLHPEVIGEHFEGARRADGTPLVHAEATSRPIRVHRSREPQPRSARIRGDRPIDQVGAAAEFLAAPEHAHAHDEHLWDMRVRRDKAAHGIPEWEELRTLASRIKEHALSRLDVYVQQFAEAARANGVTVHWASDAAEHNRIVHGILADHGAKTLIKSKSMLTDEVCTAST